MKISNQKKVNKNMVTEFTIPRSKWVNGDNMGNENPSEMLNSVGNKCCLGHYATACGVIDEQLLEQATPNSVDIYYGLPKQCEWLKDSCGHFINVNDNAEKYYSVNREDEITVLFRQRGITVKFVD